MELMNLQLVDNDITEYFEEDLYQEILSEFAYSNERNAAQIMNELEMYSLNSIDIVKRITKLNNYLKIEDETNITDKRETTTQSALFGLFS